ncbi:MAG: hypothetical protein H0X31_22705, partial [Nostocaceae cyanobacterium]|nr:hypothetical protein [Nostocaceae cyanobacterium]
MSAETEIGTIEAEVYVCHNMHSKKLLDSIDLQLKNLTLNQLLCVRIKIDEMIQKKTVSANVNQDVISHLSREISPAFAAIYIHLIEQKQNPNNSLEHVNNLVSEWMQDESG